MCPRWNLDNLNIFCLEVSIGFQVRRQDKIFVPWLALPEQAQISIKNDFPAADLGLEAIHQYISHRAAPNVQANAAPRGFGEGCPIVFQTSMFQSSTSAKVRFAPSRI